MSHDADRDPGRAAAKDALALFLSRRIEQLGLSRAEAAKKCGTTEAELLLDLTEPRSIERLCLLINRLGADVEFVVGDAKPGRIGRTRVVPYSMVV
ncbi:XRE family transcriptional regulator [Methylobacterium gnaphalii]|uniref:HigA2-like helix-turn-helix domain-containing protein n=1 Tax=Methylobacterium gnaphalii TaxID=1010610 RepID=A0A512JRF2_9HYPH|nr:XRE family transcriptional regulator [Methylobacterium gnaphalii]GEP12536.1 hypothetical protein MGN01_43810 [Methylobacterium gnaphalii]GJD70191.1 hypothetical protein MMMDOFMJ_3133 [Methylobacterium gnaphalii]GLS51502.1 hypothetical protein GCM10007885_43600 [Methylobacterium gnaphalii]